MDLMARRRAIMGMPSGKDYTVSGNVVSVSNALAKNAKSAIVTFLPKQSGSGDPSPNNVRPISGYNDIGAVRLNSNIWGGKDMADDFAGTYGYSIDTTTKTFTFERRIPSGQTVCDFPFQGGVYTLILTVTAVATNTSLQVRYTDGSYSSVEISPSSEKTVVVFHSNSSKTVKNIGVGWAQTGKVTFYYEECGLFVGNVNASAFEPYISPVTANVHSDTTIFGGTVDLVSGELVVTWGMADMGTLGWQYNTSYNYPYFHTGVPSDNIVTEWNVTSIGCSFYKPLVGMTGGSFRNNSRDLCIAPIYGQGTSFRVALQDSSVTSAADLKTKVNGQQLIYQFAAPVTYHLTPSQLALLKGNNTVYSNEGSISLTYVGK